MKILWIGDALINSGFSVVTHNILSHFSNPELYVYGIGYDGLLPNSYHYHIIPANQYGDIYGFSGLSRILNYINPDVTVVFNDLHISSQYINKLSSHSTRKVMILPINFFPIDNTILHNVIPNTNIILTYTNYAKSKVLEISPTSVVETIYHGVDTSVYKPIPNAKSTAGLSNVFVVGNVNSNTYRKRPDLFLQAFAKFAHNKDDVKCLLHTSSGADYDIPKLAKRYNIQNKAILSTAVVPPDKLCMYYNLMDVICSTSMGEGFGLCVHPDTKLISENSQLKTIRECVVGDTVLCGDGKFLDILAIKSRKANALVRISSTNSDDILVTREHPILVQRGIKKHSKSNMPTIEGNVEWLKAHEIIPNKDYVCCPIPKLSMIKESIDYIDFVDCANWNVEDNSVEIPMSFLTYKSSLREIMAATGETKKTVWTAIQVCKGKRVNYYSNRVKNVVKYIQTHHIQLNTSRRFPRFIKLDKKFLEFLGWYLAEGSTGPSVVNLAFHKDEKSIAEDLGKYINLLFGLSYSVSISDNRCRLDISGCYLARLLESLCGKGAHNKRIHPKIFGKNLLSMFKTYVLGDGYTRKDGLSVSTVSNVLAQQWKLILMSNGYAPSVRCQTDKSIYVLRLCGEFYRDLSMAVGFKYQEKENRCRRIYSRILKDSNYFYFKVKNVENVEYNGNVWDIQLPSSNFVANGIVVHNSLIESAACGVPVVCSDLGNLRDIWNDNATYIKIDRTEILPNTGEGNVDGEIISVDDLVNHLERLYTDSTHREEMAKKALSRANSLQFDWTTVAGLVYKNIINAFNDSVYVLS